MRNLLLLSVVLVFSSACPGRGGGGGVAPPPPPPTATRTPAVSPSSPLYDRVEGAGFANDCASDAACFRAGCSSEVCSAAGDVVTTCEVQAWPQGDGASCGCVAGQCVWYREVGAVEDKQGGVQGTPCLEGQCDPGLTCVKYYGIAGPRGPQFTSCEVPCEAPDAVCPPGQACITIADGPGRVCRPERE